MPDIVRELTIAATPERVFDALTQPGEIGQWWTNDLNASPEVGSLAELRFGEWGEFVFRFEIAELDQNKKVHWITRQGPSTGHWKGTSVTWRLTPVHGGTQVVFTHSGFAQAARRDEITRAWCRSADWPSNLCSPIGNCGSPTETPPLSVRKMLCMKEDRRWHANRSVSDS